MSKQFYFKQFSLAYHLFALRLNAEVYSLNFTQLYLTHRFAHRSMPLLPGPL